MQGHKFHLDLNFREAQQTLGDVVPPEKSLLNPDLDPPGRVNFPALRKTINQLVDRPEVLIELFSPISSPTCAQNLKSVIDYASAKGVSSQIATHVRIVRDDFELAIGCGAKMIFLFGSIKSLPGGNSADMLQMSREITQLQKMAPEDLYLRVSLEHAGETNKLKVEEFIRIVQTINNKGKDLIKGLGLPDTDGAAYPKNYVDFISNSYRAIRKGKFQLFTHLHNDEGRALDNLESIKSTCQQFGIPWVLESVPADYPGERVGIQPVFSDVEAAHFAAMKVIVGPSWVRKQQSPKFAKCGHVAGVHTNSMAKYSKERYNFPSPGVYTIMGTYNLGAIQEMLFSQPSDKSILKKAALIGREYAAQFGNTKQSYAIALARLAHDKPGLIEKTASSFGPPAEWLIKSKPNLTDFKDEWINILQ